MIFLPFQVLVEVNAPQEFQGAIMADGDDG